MSNLTSWKDMLSRALRDNNETWDDVESNTMTRGEMRRKFEKGYGGTKGVPFTVWTSKSVYFPVCYDGTEWVGRVSRHPDGKPTEHQGG